MRQRKGKPAEEPSAKDQEIAKLKAQLEAAQPKSKEEQQNELAERIFNTLKEKQDNQVKGLSHRAKEYKDKLMADPYNMEYIFHLGAAYAVDGLWDKAQNVLLRGYKRVKEIEDAGARFKFLSVLAEASLKTNKFKQAMAVMNDMEEPTEEEQKPFFELLRCNIYCENGDMEKGLRSLNKAFEGQEYDEALKMWSSCLSALRKVGAVEMSKEKLLDMAPNEEAKGKVAAMEALITVVRNFEAHNNAQPLTRVMKSGLVLLISVLAAGVIYILYLLESRSLSRMNIGNS